MWKIMDRHLLCICLLAIPLSWAEDTKKASNEKDSVWSQRKHRQLFARRRTSPPQGNQLPKLKPEITPMTPARRCSRLTENCSSHVPCCDPCASCRCRLFNTICNCWRMGPKCSKRT